MRTGGRMSAASYCRFRGGRHQRACRRRQEKLTAEGPIDAFDQRLLQKAKRDPVAMGITLGAMGSVVGSAIGVGNEVDKEASSLSNGRRGTNMSDDESFAYHYGAHGDAQSPEEFAASAAAWAQNPAGIGTPVGLADGTPGLRYRTPGGGPGGILDELGHIVTFWNN
jgi:hypothetical protein